MEILSKEKIAVEMQNLSKPVAYNGIELPFNSLGDRAFEYLLYHIYKDKIERNEHGTGNRFDNVDIMQGVGEQGRDCILCHNGKTVGVIQCKKHNSNITKPQFIKEVLKFLMFSIIDKSIITDPREFTYYFAVSKGLAGTTKELIRDFGTLILKEVDIEKWVNELTTEYKRFQGLTYKNIKSELNTLLQTIKIERILPQDLELWLSNSTNVLRLFFEVRSVSDNTLIQKIEHTYLIPILSILKQEKGEKLENFSNGFREYLNRSYNYYSSARTLVFGNQQKKLGDFYYPLELIHKNITIKTKNYPDDLLPKYKKVIVVDSGGMGKSTAMKWLFINAIKENKGIPIFIELRLLSEKNTLVDEIINQISSIDKPFAKSLVLKLISKGNFIFFFDGYDEIKMTEKNSVTKDLTDFISKAGKNQFIITSRPENSEGIFSDFLSFHIKPLSTNDAYKLIEKIGDYNHRSKSLIKKLQESDLKNIKEFLKTPLLISLLYKKFEYRESLPFQKQEFYYEVFEALFKAHDLTKGTDYYIRPKESNLSFSDFFRVLRILGFRSIQENELEYNKSVLIKLINDIKSDLTNITYDAEALLTDLIVAVPLFQKEGLMYKWAHKSIQEYFAAEFICIDAKEEQSNILLAIYNGVRFNNLLHVLDLCYDIDPKTFKSSIIYEFCSEFITYCKESFIDVIEKNTIPIGDIRNRQFRLYIEDCYLVKCEMQLKTANQAKAVFSEKFKGKGIKIVNRSSSDNYYIVTIKKRIKVRTFLNFLRRKNHSLIKEVESRDFMYLEDSNGNIKKSGINFFNGTINEEIIYINDDPNSPVNSQEYFKNISTLLRAAYLDYYECERIVLEVDNDRTKSKLDKKLTSGF